MLDMVFQLSPEQEQLSVTGAMTVQKRKSEA